MASVRAVATGLAGALGGQLTASASYLRPFAITAALTLAGWWATRALLRTGFLGRLVANERTAP
jgi:hypothetical protein